MSGVVSPERLRALAVELEAQILLVPGVERVQPRPGVGRFARRVAGLASGIASGAGAGSVAHEPRVGLAVSADATVVSLDVAIGREHAAPVVVRAVAAIVLERLAPEGLPVASVDVRIVAVG